MYRTRSARGSLSSVIGVLLVVWLIIGVIATAQRHYFSSKSKTCAHTGTVVVTILAGPLNYAGVNPKLTCHIPQPSK